MQNENAGGPETPYKHNEETIYGGGRPLRTAPALAPITRDQSVRALCAVSHMLEAAAHLLMIGNDTVARDLIAEANVVMEEVPAVEGLK